MGTPLNSAYFSNLTAQINAASSCSELQAVATVAVNSLNELTASITAQAAIVEPVLALLTAPTNPTAVITWVQDFISNYLTPQLVSYTAYVSQLAALATEATALIAALENAAVEIGSCSITIPTFSPGSIPSPPSPPSFPPFGAAGSISGSATTADPIQLAGDSENPGDNKVYGTNSSGVKGWYAAGGGGYSLDVTDGTTTVANVDQISVVGATVSGTSPNVTITVSGGGSGTVTNVATGAGLTGGPITTSGTIALSSASIAALALATTALQSVTQGTGISVTGGGSTVNIANTTVTPGSYTAANITVNAQGQITAASNGSGGSGATSYFGAGAPTTLHNDGDLYFDTSVSPFNGYVQYSAAVTPTTETVATGEASVTNTVSANVTTAGASYCLAVVSAGFTGTVSTVTGVTASGLTFTKYTSVQSSGGTVDVEIWMAPLSGSVSSLAVTATFGTNFDDATIAVFGVNTFGGFDAGSGLPASATNVSGGGAPTIGPVTTSAIQDLMLYVCSTNSGSDGGTPSGYTQIAEIENNGAVNYCHTQIAIYSPNAVLTGYSLTSPYTVNAPAGLLLVAISPSSGPSWFRFN